MPYKDKNSEAAKASQKRRTANYKRKHPERYKATHNNLCKRLYRTESGKRAAQSNVLKTTYGITMDDLDGIISLQNGLCLLCKLPLDLATKVKLAANSPVIDHDHSCCSTSKSCGKCIRGVIHRKCNIGLGMFNDNSVLLRLAAEYIDRRSYVKS